MNEIANQDRNVESRRVYHIIRLLINEKPLEM